MKERKLFIETYGCHRITSYNVCYTKLLRSPRIARLMPGFIYRYLHHILHIDFLNEVLVNYGHLEGIDFVDSVVEMFNVKEHLHGTENIPVSGKYIFASNHPLGGFDGLLLMKNVRNNFV